MGQDKALLQLNDQSLLEHMQQLASDAGACEVLISRNQPGFIQDKSQQGPLSGILAALAHCTSPQLLVLPIDTPLLNAASLRHLLRQADGAAAYFSDSPLPCVLPVNPELSDIVRRQLQQGQGSVRALLTLLQAKTLTIAATELLNTNTPHDWQQCLSLLASGANFNRSNYAKT